MMNIGIDIGIGLIPKCSVSPSPNEDAVFLKHKAKFFTAFLHQTCAHLYELRQRVGEALETRDPIGRCYVLSEDLTERDNQDGGDWKFCEGRTQGHEQFGFCQQGLSASFTPDNNFILFGAPGTYNWKGNVCCRFTEERNPETLFLFVCFSVKGFKGKN